MAENDLTRNPLIHPGSPAETAANISRVALFLAVAGHHSEGEQLDDGRDMIVTCIQQAAEYLSTELHGGRHG